jgi:BON domain
MTRALATFTAGVGFGAGLAFFLDPDRGARRRTHARNQLMHASRVVRDNSRTQLRAIQQAQQSIEDSELADQVRATLARVVSHAQALAIEVSRGIVTVSGPILREELRLAIKALKRVPGVRDVVDALEPQSASPRTSTRRVAAALASVASLGLMAAAMRARQREFELQP